MSDKASLEAPKGPKNVTKRMILRTDEEVNAVEEHMRIHDMTVEEAVADIHEKGTEITLDRIRKSTRYLSNDS